MDLINSLNIDLELDVHENEARSTSHSLCDERVLPALDRVLRRFEDEDIVIEEPLIFELGDVPEGQLLEVRTTTSPTLEDPVLGGLGSKCVIIVPKGCAANSPIFV